MKEEYITVSQLNRYIKFRLDNDENLQEVYLRGEISNFKAHTRGHFYFTLKDESARINAIMFASNTSRVKFVPMDGMKVLITGKINVYEASGSYQIYVNSMQEDGVGNLYVAFEQLKKKLQEEGLFDEAHKKKIPRIPKRIGVITAPTGAAIRDILSTIKRRFPLTEVLLLPALVQGEAASLDIASQIKNAENYDLDVLIVGRGGGSIEDLWAFNEEIVARAIYDCKIPIISAVGHEVDYTIADFVADLRAPTPTGAAELAVPSKTDVANYISQLVIRSKKAMVTKLNYQKQVYNQILSRPILKNPLSLYEPKEQKFDLLYEKLLKAMKKQLEFKAYQINLVKQSTIFKMPKRLLEKKVQQYVLSLEKLELLNPLLTLKRGYTIAKQDGKAITSIRDVKEKEKLEISFQDGSLITEVLEKCKNEQIQI